MERLSTIQQINQSIMFGSFTNAELNSIVDAVRFARAGLTQKAKREFCVGSAVKFHSTRLGVTVRGTVTKVAIKYITVKDPVRGLWKVPANVLEAA